MLLVYSPAGVEHFFEEAAERPMPLQAEPTDPAVAEKLAVFTGKYGYEFAEFSTGSQGPRVWLRSSTCRRQPDTTERATRSIHEQGNRLT